MERLDTIYNNNKYDDDTILIRIINTALEKSEEPSYIYHFFIHHMILLEELYKKSKIIRPDVKYIIDQMNNILSDLSFNHYVSILEKIYITDLNISKNLWLLCFLRSIFELKYEKFILYKKPEYAIKITLGESTYSVFLESLKSKDYIFINNNL